MFKKVLSLLLALILMIPSGIVALAADNHEYGADEAIGEPLDPKEIPEEFLSDEKAETLSEESAPEETDRDASIPGEPSDPVSGSDGEISYISEEENDPQKERAELFEAYIYQLAGLDANGNKTSASRKNSVLSAGDYLGATEKKVYDELKTAIKKIASGEVKSTTIIIKTDLPDNSKKRKIVMALLADCPYDLYWFDKTMGWTYSGSRTYKFPVAKEYSATDSEKSYITNIVGVSDAVETAKGIVEANKAKNKYNKLKAYATYIMENVSYNYDAIVPGYPYGNPWQLIWAFDGDSKTNVVCEGYSKAFKFLCDITTENGYWNGVECNLVMGNLFQYDGNRWNDLGGHMWNTVHIDGTNYLVDVTNCDDTNSYSFNLFLCGITEDQNNKDRLVPITNSTLSYIYDADTKNSFPTSALTLSQNNYEYVPIPGGTGTEYDPYWITDEDELRLVSENLSAYYKLGTDIILTSDWTPIGTSSEPFIGTFDGNGYVIENLHIDCSASYVGLFGYNEGTIQNLGVMDSGIKATSTTDIYAGGITGYNTGVIKNCFNTGSVRVSSPNDTYAGGITGCNSSGTIEKCYNTGEVDTTGNSSSTIYAGGLIGYNNNGTLKNSYNTGAVYASSSSDSVYAGGITGYQNSSQAIQNCYNVGTVHTSTEMGSYSGGVAGYSTGTFTDCYCLNNVEKVIGQGSGSATALSVMQMKKPSSFSGFDFTDTWSMTSFGYPYPQLVQQEMTLNIEDADYKVETSEYVVGWDLVLVYTDDIVPGFTYDGAWLYDVSDLGYKLGTVWNENGTDIVSEGTAYTYVYALVINGDAIESKVSPSDNKAKTIDQDNALNRFDTNNSNTVDINDLVAVAAVYNVNGEYLNEERMSVVLLADVSGNKMVDTYDCSLIKSNTGI